MHSVNCSSPAHADDVATVALYSKPMQKLLDVTYGHSCKWRYLHNVLKCVVLHFSSKRSAVPPTFYLGGSPIPCKTVSVHMGVPIGEITDVTIDELIIKGKRSIYALQGLTRSGHVMDPAVASKVYWSVTIPTMLFGLEALPLSGSHMAKLEKAHRQMAKSVQGLPGHTPDPAVLAQIGWCTIQSYIDRKRLLLVWKILNMDQQSTIKKVTLCRLTQFQQEPDNTQVCVESPLRITFKTARKYGLLGDLMQMTFNTGGTYAQWKAKVSLAITQRETDTWRARCMLYPSLIHYRVSIPNITMCSFWRLAVARPDLRQMQ